ncbi:MAG: SRPBCC family protein [Actinomycetota bacterium]
MDVTIQTTIARPREHVADYVMDHEHDTAWIGGITESELLGEPPLRVGSDVRRVAHFLGRRIDYVLRVERLDPGTFLGMRSVKAPFPMTVDYAFEDGGPGTTVRIRVGGEPGRMYRLTGPMLARQTEKSIASDLERLKTLLEAEGA